MIKLSLKIGICTTFLLHSLVSTQAAEGEMATIIDRALSSGGLAAKALHEEKAFREVTIRQIKELRHCLGQAQEGTKVEPPETWREKVLTLIRKDEEAANALNEALKPFQSGVNVCFSVKTNKTVEILKGVKDLLTASFFDLLDGNTPAGYAFDQSTVTMLGGDNTLTIWGNSKGTYLKTAYLYLLMTQEEGSSKRFGGGLNWFDQSALAHVAPLPDDLTLDLSSFSFACSYPPEIKRGLVLPHSGYAFGGHRFEPHYPQGKKFGPQDCSSGLAYLTDSPSYTTADQLCAYRKILGRGGFTPPNWESGTDARYLLENMRIVDVQDPQKDIRPGLIYWHRRFANTDPTMMDTLGVGGHTAITLGYLSDGNVVTIGYNRDMPKLEGFGIQNFLWATEPLKMKVLFDVKGRH